MAPNDFDRFQYCENLLSMTYDEVKSGHPRRGHEYIKTHWIRTAALLAKLPDIRPDWHVLEVGASILSNLIRRRYGARVSVVYHELETEWKHRFDQDGIASYPAELMRDQIPVPDNSFDLIIFAAVLEHFPLAPDFFIKQLIQKLKPEGILVLSVPNFALFEKRIQFLHGANPQDEMDSKYIYYAHHREPVMRECLNLIERCGGVVRHYEWTDYDRPPRNMLRMVFRLFYRLVRLKLNQVAHILFRSARGHIHIEAIRRRGYSPSPEEMAPPLSYSGEFKITDHKN